MKFVKDKKGKHRQHRQQNEEGSYMTGTADGASGPARNWGAKGSFIVADLKSPNSELKEYRGVRVPEGPRG